jgi:predicted ATP-dependent serine protease
MNNGIIKYYTGKELTSLKITEPKDMVEGLIRETSMCFLVGEEGCGKSILAMNLGLAIATGKDTILNYKIHKKGKVLYLNNELPFPEFVSRFNKMVKPNSHDQTDKLQNFIIPNRFPLLSEYKIDLDAKCRQEKPILIIIDCLYWTHNNKENDNSEMKNVLRDLVSLRDEHQTAILIIHHTKKGSKSELMHNDNIRGASVFGGVADSIFQIRRSSKNEELRLLKPTKLRYGDDKIKKVKLLSLNSNSLLFIDEGETNESEHIAYPEQRETAEKSLDWKQVFKPDEVLSRKDVIKRCEGLGFTNRTIDRELKRAKDTEIIKSPKHGSYSL